MELRAKLFAALLLLVAAAPTAGAGEPPDLLQRMAACEVAVLGTVDEVSYLARLRVEEIYAGRLEGPHLFVHYRPLSWERRVEGLDRIRFQEGERFVVFLRYRRNHGKVERPDLFELANGDWGAIPLRGEDDTLHVEAMRLLMGALARPEPAQRDAVLVGLLGSGNPLAAAAAMRAVADRGLADIQSIPPLLRQMDTGIAGLKRGALRILRRMGPTLPSTFQRGSLAEAIQQRVAWDGADPPEVRLEAVEALGSLGPAARPALEAVSRADADQQIRYRAAVLALELPGNQ